MTWVDKPKLLLLPSVVLLLTVSGGADKMRAMIRLTIREEAERRGITTAYQLGQELGLSPNQAARLWKGEKHPTLGTLDKICTKWGCGLDTLVTCAREPAQRKTKAAKKR